MNELSKPQQDAIEKCKLILSEHFDNFVMFVESADKGFSTTEWIGSFQSKSAEIGMMQMIERERDCAKVAYGFINTGDECIPDESEPFEDEDDEEDDDDGDAKLKASD